MLSNECWFGRHNYCESAEYCDCLCHVNVDQLLADIGEIDE